MSQSKIINVDSAELRQRLDQEQMLLLDVRRIEDAEADPVRIPGATWRDPAHVASWSATLSEGESVALYCVRGGSVSQSVAEALAAKGHETLRLEGGLAAWRDSGGTVTPVE